MSKFTDSQGREWSIEIDLLEIERVRRDCWPEFLKPDPANPEASEVMLTMVRLKNDLVQRCFLIETLCQPQYTAHGLDKRAFLLGLRGESLERATDALREAIADFIPPSTSEAARLLAAMDDRLLRLRTLELRRLMNDEQAIERLARSGLAALDTPTPSRPATDSADSAASTPSESAP